MKKYLLSILALCAIALTAPHTTHAVEKKTVVPCRESNEQCWPAAFDITPVKGNILYAERYTGEIRKYNKKTKKDTLWAEIENIASNGEQGVLGIALDPRWPDKKWVYVYFTRETPLENRIIRLRKKKNGSIERERLITLPAASNHNGGALEFGPDQKLYAVVGDVGTPTNAQDKTTNTGKVLRLNKDGSIPSDNPRSGTVRWFSYGHRNMFGITFDPFNFNPTNLTAWITENGPECNDEVNRVRKNKNYGWGDNAACPRINNSGTKVTAPAYRWEEVIAVTGAAFCDDCKLGESVKGDLVVGAWNTGEIMHATLNNGRTKIIDDMTTLYTNDNGILSMRAGNKKKILFSDPYGIYRLTK